MAKRTPKSARGAAAGRTRLLFLTNRANVLPVLSSGLIRPRAEYTGPAYPQTWTPVESR